MNTNEPSDKQESEAAARDGFPWWWREIENLRTVKNWTQDLIEESVWQTTRMHSAFQYELRARITGRFEFGKPYPELTPKQKSELAERWPSNTKLGTVYKITSPENIAANLDRHLSPPDSGWSNWFGITLNLSLNNKTLLSNLEQQIKAERQRMGLQNPAKNKGKKHRAPSWRYLELIDISRLKLRPLNRSESSQKSKALRLLPRASI